jgi:hypothetical protein
MKEGEEKNVLATIATEDNEIRRGKQSIYTEKKGHREKKNKQMAIRIRKKSILFFLRINKEEEFKYVSIYVFIICINCMTAIYMHKVHLWFNKFCCLICW